MQTLIVLALFAFIFRLTMAYEEYTVNCFFHVSESFAIELLASYLIQNQLIINKLFLIGGIPLVNILAIFLILQQLDSPILAKIKHMSIEQLLIIRLLL